MARISSFPLDDNIGLNDILFGSENNGIGANGQPIYVTKNYRIGDLSNFFGLSGDNVTLNTTKLTSLATFNADGSVASLQNATVSLINTATTAAGFATSSSVTAVNSRVDIILGSGGSSVSQAFANQVFTTTTNSDFAAATDVTEIKSQFTYSGSDINGLASGTTISTAIATAETSAVSTANAARAAAETALVATISKVFRQTSAPAVTEPVNSIWYDTDDNNKPYVLVTGTPRVWTAVNDPTLATSASVTTVSDAVALVNGKLSARYGIKVATGNVFAGMELMSNSDATGAVSDIIFTATNFKIKTIDGSGNVSPVAPFTVSGANGSNVVSIDGSLKIGNTSLTDVTTKANSATQSSDHASIQAGTTAANVGLANVVNSNFDSNGNVIGGAVGGTTINSTKIFQGTGTFGNANTGFYLDNGGNFSLRDKLVFNGSTGDLSIAGAISATSGTIANGVTIGGTAASTVASGAASGATANQTSTADIRAVGAATSGTIAGISISGSELYQGAGNFNNADTGFYLGSNGTFSLKDKLSWNGTTLTINGNGTFSGALSAASGSFAGDISSASGTFTGNLSVGSSNTIFKATTDGIQLGHATFGSAPFRVTAAGVLTATSGSFAGSITGATGTFAGVTINSNGISGTGFTLNSSGLTATSGSFTGVVNATSGSFAGNISSATGTFTGGISGTGYTLNNSGLQLDNASSVINLGNSVVLSSNGLTGQGFELTSTGIEASSGLIGGWSIGSNLSSSDGEMTMNPATNSIQIFEGSDVRVDINSNENVSDPEQTGSVTSVNSLTATTTTPSTQSGNISYSSGKNVYIYSSDTGSWTGSTLPNKTVQYSIAMSADGYTIQVTDGSGDFVGSMSCVAGLAFSTSTNTSDIFHYTSSATASRSDGGSASISNTTVTGTFVWPNQNTVYIFGWNKNVNISGTNYSGEPPSGPQTSAITFKTPVATPATGNITLTISKCELVPGGLLIAKDTSNFLRVNRKVSSSAAWSSNFIHSKMYAWRHEGRLAVVDEFNGSGVGISGDLLIGQTSPTSSSNGSIRIFTSSGVPYIDYTGGTLQWRNTSSGGGVKINFESNGNILNSNGSYGTISSDERLKKNITDATGKLEDLLLLKVINYEFISDENPGKKIGFKAQEFEKVFPSLVFDTDTREYDEDNNVISGYEDQKGLYVGMEFAILTKAIQEQQAIIQSQKTLIEDLTARVTALES